MTREIYHCEECSKCFACGGGKHEKRNYIDPTDGVDTYKQRSTTMDGFTLKMSNDTWLLYHNGVHITDGIRELYDDNGNLKSMFHMLNETNFPTTYDIESIIKAGIDADNDTTIALQKYRRALREFNDAKTTLDIRKVSHPVNIRDIQNADFTTDDMRGIRNFEWNIHELGNTASELYKHYEEAAEKAHTLTSRGKYMKNTKLSNNT
jgi:hypothetical protein